MNDMFIASRQDFIELADAIRTKAKVKDGLAFPSGMIEAIEGIGGSSGSGSGSGGSSSGVSSSYRALVPYPISDFRAEIPDTVINAVIVPYAIPVPVFSFEEVTE